MTQSSDNLPLAAPGEMLDVAIWVDAMMLAREAAFVRHLVMGLKADGHRVTFIGQNTLDFSLLPTLGSRCLTYGWTRWERLPMLQRIRLSHIIDQLKKDTPDVLLVWGSVDAAQIELISHLTHAVHMPVVAWCWDASELFSPLMRLPAVRHIIAASEPIAARATARADASVPVTVITPGVYVDDAPACFDVPGQLPCLVSLDPLSDRRLYQSLLQACRMIADARVEFLLFAYDAGRDEYAIWREAERLGILDHVSFVPFQQDAEPLLLHGDLYLHVLPQARVQYRTLEAMGRGLVVISAPDHAADYLIDGQTCRIVRDQTPEAWREALMEMISDPARAVLLARRAQQHVRDRHALMRSIVQFASLCRMVSGAPLAVVGR